VRLPFFIARNVYLRKASGQIELACRPQTGLIRIGFGNVGIFDDKRSRTIWNVEGKIVFDGKTDIGHGSKISVGKDGVLHLGSNFKISAESSIVVEKYIRFGSNCLLSWDILIMDTDFHPIRDSSGILSNAPEPIIIEDHVWIGCRSSIYKGATIPHDSVIASNTRVSRALTTPHCIYAGEPAKCVRENINWNQESVSDSV
jgi:NDP-sugar pyrophosphorylase family protein